MPEGNVASYTHKRKENSRERILSDDELKTIWNASGGGSFGAAIKLLILTGQREKEIGLLHWDEVGEEEITLPAHRTKNGRTHVVPLSEPAKAILSEFKDDSRQHVFGRDARFRGWPGGKRLLDGRAPPPLDYPRSAPHRRHWDGGPRYSAAHRRGRP